MAQAHVLKSTDYTNILRMRDIEETILCPRVIATKTFFPVTFFSDGNFLIFVLQHKEEA